VRRAPDLAPRWTLAVALAAVAACAGRSPGVRDATSARRLEVHAVDFNPSHAKLPPATTVADLGGEVAVFSADGASVLQDGQLVAEDKTARGFRRAAIIPATDGSGSWIAGVDQDGKLRRLRNARSFEAVGSRYGLDGTKLRDVCAFGGAFVGFLLDGELAVADGVHVTRYAAPSFQAIAGGGTRAAAIAGDEVRAIDLAAHTVRSLPVDGAKHVAFDGEGRLWVATDRAIYAEDEQHDLHLRFESTGDGGGIHGLVASTGRIWFADGEELGSIDHGEPLETRGVHLSRDAELAPSSSGDVWVVSHGALARYAWGPPQATPETAWNAEVQPVFERVCKKCHAAGGSSGIDLGTFAAWDARRATVHKRLIDDKTMPPPGTPISDADRDAVRRWLEGK